MNKWVARIVVPLAWMFMIVAPAPARADAVSGFDDWRVPTGEMCAQHTDTAVAASVWRWSSMTDVNIVTKASCADYPRNRTLMFRTLNEPTGGWCTRFNANGWVWQYVRDDWTWTAKYPTLEVNAGRAKTCQNSWASKLHLYVHEMGHWLGLAHNNLVSVMCQSSNSCGYQYTEPQKVDIERVNSQY